MFHTFHIPVLGLGYSIDTPLKVARYGISSVVSIVDDELTERMRAYHCKLNGLEYHPIGKTQPESRSQRITAYLDLLNSLVKKQIKEMKKMSFEGTNDLTAYFELLPVNAPAAVRYRQMLDAQDPVTRLTLQEELRQAVTAGSIDVNIMSKVDKINYLNGKMLAEEHTDALAALRGFARSSLRSSLVISAGMNPRLFSYMEQFKDFYPDKNGSTCKKVILKVSDYRSAMIQAKVLAKKGIWVSEFRIESGLNCGGHAFATEGLLIGPILQEFRDNRNDLYTDLYEIYIQGLAAKQPDHPLPVRPHQNISVQGGVGTSEEHDFLISHYQLDKVGWGSPFLLVPEATNVDEQTLKDLASAAEDDFYLSNASPLGVPFNNFRKSSSEQQRLERISLGKPGSPCTKKYLCSNTEFTVKPICTASRQYQRLKISQLNESGLSEEELQQQIGAVTEKVCLCEGLCASVYLKNEQLKSKENKAVSICPGPNIAYFNRPYSLREMTGHIYGRYDLLRGIERPNLFIKELDLYISYFRKQFEQLRDDLKKQKYLNKFYDQLVNGINYYTTLGAEADKKLQLWNTSQQKRLDHSISILRAILGKGSVPANG